MNKEGGGIFSSCFFFFFLLSSRKFETATFAKTMRNSGWIEKNPPG